MNTNENYRYNKPSTPVALGIEERKVRHFRPFGQDAVILHAEEAIFLGRAEVKGTGRKARLRGKSVRGVKSIVIDNDTVKVIAKPEKIAKYEEQLLEAGFHDELDELTNL